MSRSTLTFLFFDVVAFVYDLWGFKVHSRWLASPVNSVVISLSSPSEPQFDNCVMSQIGSIYRTLNLMEASHV